MDISFSLFLRYHFCLDRLLVDVNNNIPYCRLGSCLRIAGSTSHRLAPLPRHSSFGGQGCHSLFPTKSSTGGVYLCVSILVVKFGSCMHGWTTKILVSLFWPMLICVSPLLPGCSFLLCSMVVSWLFYSSFSRTCYLTRAIAEEDLVLGV